MAWEARPGGRYYYRKVKDGGRVRSVYIGAGPRAEAIARDLEEARQAREAAWAATREARAAAREARADRVRADRGIKAEALDVLDAEGIRLHRGHEWRRRNGA